MFIIQKRTGDKSEGIMSFWSSLFKKKSKAGLNRNIYWDRNFQFYTQQASIAALLEKIDSGDCNLREPVSSLDDFILFNYSSYEASTKKVNLGDYVQSIATKSAIKQISEGRERNFKFYDRDSLSFYKSENPCVAVMQGWFSYSYAFLPSKSIVPIWVGTHFTIETQDFLRKVLSINPNYFSNTEIGCRDLFTYNFCERNGINSYFSRCLTLTLPRRQKDSTQNKVFLVDVPKAWEKYLPTSITRSAVRLSQRTFSCADLNSGDLYKKANELLEMYRDEAALVITTALHCASPCLAMGIPVVFLTNQPEEQATRFSALSGISRTYSLHDLKNKKLEIPSEPVDIEDLKQALLGNLKLCLVTGGADKVDEKRRLRSYIKDFCIL